MNGCIVVGTDGSETAGRAMATAIRMARDTDRQLHIVSAYQPRSVPGKGLPAELRSVITAHSRVESVLADAECRARIAGVTVRTYAKVGNAAEAILEVADEVAADVIVVGDRGLTSKARLVTGNVPNRVVHHATCSTMLVHTAQR